MSYAKDKTRKETLSVQHQGGLPGICIRILSNTGSCGCLRWFPGEGYSKVLPRTLIAGGCIAVGGLEYGEVGFRVIGGAGLVTRGIKSLHPNSVVPGYGEVDVWKRPRCAIRVERSLGVG